MQIKECKSSQNTTLSTGDNQLHVTIFRLNTGS